MEAKEQNYGTVKEPGEAGPAAGVVGPDPLGTVTREERTWAVVAHLSVFLNLFTVVLGPVAALAVWLVYRDRSKEVAFQALQSAVYQAGWLAILGAGWAITGLLTFVLIGFLLIPAMALITLVPFVHGAYAAYRVGRDGEYRYPVVADLIENR